MMADEYLEIDLNNLRIREIEEIEEIAGKPFDELFANGSPRGKSLRALGFIVKKRENPTFTLEDAGELIIKVKTDDEPADPTGASEDV